MKKTSLLTLFLVSSIQITKAPRVWKSRPVVAQEESSANDTTSVMPCAELRSRSGIDSTATPFQANEHGTRSSFTSRRRAPQAPQTESEASISSGSSDFVDPEADAKFAAQVQQIENLTPKIIDLYIGALQRMPVDDPKRGFVMRELAKLGIDPETYLKSDFLIAQLLQEDLSSTTGASSSSSRPMSSVEDEQLAKALQRIHEEDQKQKDSELAQRIQQEESDRAYARNIAAIQNQNPSGATSSRNNNRLNYNRNN